MTKRIPHSKRKFWRHGYGAFPGGDPREFTPDEECSTPEEREAYRLACEAAARGESNPAPAHAWIGVDEARKALAAGGVDAATIGGSIAHVTYTRFGLGGYRYREPMTSRRANRRMSREAGEWAEQRIDALLAEAAERKAARGES